MTDLAPEFSRVVPLKRLGAEPVRRDIAASEAERDALTRRFGLIALSRLTAVVEMARQWHGTILLRGAFEAAFVQECAVTLEPVAGEVSGEFALRYGPPEAEALMADRDDGTEAFEPLGGDSIDIGEAVAQEFSLALPPFPRHPDASDAAETQASPLVNPFAALERRRSGG